MRELLVLLSLAIFAGGCAGDAATTEETEAAETTQVEEKTEALSEDAKAIESTCLAMLEAFSTKKGTPPDWEKLNSLFSEDAILSEVTNYDGTEFHQFSIESYKEEQGEWYLNNDVLETQVSITIDNFSNVANAFQTYEITYDDQEGESFKGLGILLYQLARVDGEWIITNLIWQSETEDLKISEEYLG